MNHLSELRPEQADKWAITSIDLELDRLAWREKQFDRAVAAAKAGDDAGFDEAMSDFWQSQRERGRGNSSPSE